MILRTKPYTVGCGIQLNPNGSNLRCGHKQYSAFSLAYEKSSSASAMPLASASEIALCENCKVRQHANALMHEAEERKK